MSDPSTRLSHSLIPLKLAVELIWDRVYEGRLPSQAKEETLNSIASTICVLAPLFEYHLDASQLPTAIPRNIIQGGLFKKGAQELHFIDGRAPMTLLAVSADDVSATVEALKKEFLADC